jgi:hypothetical protein
MNNESHLIFEAYKKANIPDKLFTEANPGSFPSDMNNPQEEGEGGSTELEKIFKMILDFVTKASGSPEAQQSIIKTPLSKKVPPQSPGIENEHNGPSYGALGESVKIFEAYYRSKKPLKEKIPTSVPEDEPDEHDMELQNRVCKAQETIIKKKFGAQAAQNANYAWGSGEDTIATKIYTGRKGTWTLQTTYDPDGPLNQLFKHDLEKYDHPGQYLGL